MRRKRQSIFSRLTLQPNSDWVINLCVFILLIFGTAMIISVNTGIASTLTSTDMTADELNAYKISSYQSTIIKQIAFLIGGYFVMWAMSRGFNFKRFEFLSGLIIFVSIPLMVAPIFFEGTNGSNAWITIGGMSLQPSEFTKPLMIVYIASMIHMSKKKHKLLKNYKELYKRPFFLYLVFAILLLVQRDLGTLVILTMICFMCVIVPDFPMIKNFQRNIKRLFMAGLLATVVLFGFTDIGTNILAQSPFSHVATRIENMKNPYTDIYGEGYQPATALYSISSSGVFGLGYGKSIRKYGFLTQADSDYIFAIVIEELGVIGFALIVIPYALIIRKLFYYAMKTKDQSYRVILIGTAMYLFMHFFLNIGGVMSLIPETGIPLLFISSGGSSLISICMMMGICQQCISQIRTKEIR